MRRAYLGLFAAGLILVVACNGTSPPGGPGATKDTRTGTKLTQPENSFRLEVPNLETNLKQGESKAIDIGIDRTKNFDQDVKLEFSEPPKGVMIEPADPTIKASEKQAQVTLQASKEAALGHHTITVTGTPKEGAKTSATFKIEVKKAD